MEHLVITKKWNFRISEVFCRIFLYFSKSKIAKYWVQYKENLERIFDHIPIYKIIIPVSFDQKINEMIQTYVKQQVGED